MSTFTPPALHGIIGYPLGHSMSPLMHNTAFRTLNLPGVYLSWPIEPGRLPAFVDAARLLIYRAAQAKQDHEPYSHLAAIGQNKRKRKGDGCLQHPLS